MTLPRNGIWEFGEGVDSARGVAAIVVCRRNGSCNSSCDAIACNGRRTIAFFLLFRVQSFARNRMCEGTSQTCFECGRRSQVLQSHPLPISPLLQTPEECIPRVCGRGFQTVVRDCWLSRGLIEEKMRSKRGTIGVKQRQN